MVITNNGRPVAILSSINENNLETSLNSIRRARMADTIASLQKESMSAGANKISMDEIRKEIDETRKAFK